LDKLGEYTHLASKCRSEKMIICRFCGSKVTDGINLSDGGMIHDFCLSKHESEVSTIREELHKLKNKLYSLESELKRREGLGFKLISILKSPDIASSDIKDSILVVKNQIFSKSKNLEPAYSRLASVYDYFLSYPPDWLERKQAVVAQNGGRCHSCKHWNNLHLHHKTPLSRGGSNKISNLELLCEACHSKKHKGRDFTWEFGQSETAFSKRVSNLRYALEAGRRVEFLYRKPTQKSHTKRTITPLELVNIDHRSGGGKTLCILGYCELRHADRKFALKRMKAVKVL